RGSHASRSVAAALLTPVPLPVGRACRRPGEGAMEITTLRLTVSGEPGHSPFEERKQSLEFGLVRLFTVLADLECFRMADFRSLFCSIPLLQLGSEAIGQSSKSSGLLIANLLHPCHAFSRRLWNQAFVTVG